MSNAVDEAADRLLGNSWDIYIGDHPRYWQEIIDKILLDARLVAGAYKKENDESLISTEKFLKAGFIQIETTKFGCGEFPLLKNGPLYWRCSSVTHGGDEPPDPHYWLHFHGVAMLSSDEPMWKLRMLAKVLDIQLKE